ncbi:DUF6799 domain-containing protein [Rufibacter roseus]|uniref:DUF6799 domain-containing protein n=1 Tax=Rufibacter roseus TaxID=1567108 RepID=A0ABW2DLA7_9BACT|nr:DUF6799 domain-containing protein [Rufibacter roseus]
MQKPFFFPLLMCGIVFCLTFSTAQAQNKATIQKKSSGRTTTTSVTPAREGIIMRNGKIMIILPKGYAPLTSTRSFPNGARVEPDGQFTTPEGEKQQLSDGDRLDLNGNLTRNPVVIEQKTELKGDTTGIGKQLLQAQQLQNRIHLLQRKVDILEKKNELLQSTAKNKPDAEQLKKLDEELAKLKQQLAATDKKR